MNISGYNVPEPGYGIGAEELTRRWIDREIAMRAAGMTAAANQLKMLRREVQEACNLVGDPSVLLAVADQTKKVNFLNALREIVGRHCEKNKVGTPLISDYDLIYSNEDERAEGWKIANGK